MYTGDIVSGIKGGKYNRVWLGVCSCAIPCSGRSTCPATPRDKIQYICNLLPSHATRRLRGACQTQKSIVIYWRKKILVFTKTQWSIETVIFSVTLCKHCVFVFGNTLEMFPSVNSSDFSCLECILRNYSFRACVVTTWRFWTRQRGLTFPSQTLHSTSKNTLFPPSRCAKPFAKFQKNAFARWGYSPFGNFKLWMLNWYIFLGKALNFKHLVGHSWIDMKQKEILPA